VNRHPVDRQRRPLAERFLFPAALVLLLWAALTLTYENAWKLGAPGLQKAVSWACGLGGELFRALAVLIAYPLAYVRGASLWERALASLAPFLAWWLMHMIIAAGVFGAGEALYYGISQTYLVSFFVALSLMGASEIACRRVRQRRGGGVKVWTPGPVAAVLSGPAAVCVVMLWGGGVHWFYGYQEGYRLLFHQEAVGTPGFSVIPAKAGIQNCSKRLDSGSSPEWRNPKKSRYADTLPRHMEEACQGGPAATARDAKAGAARTREDPPESRKP